MHNPGALPPPSTLNPSEFSLDVNSTLDGADDSVAFALIELDARKKAGLPGRATPVAPVQVRTLAEPIQKPGGMEVEEVGWSQFAALTDVGELPDELSLVPKPP